jgi:hypothetical protein
MGVLGDHQCRTPVLTVPQCRTAVLTVPQCRTAVLSCSSMSNSSPQLFLNVEQQSSAVPQCRTAVLCCSRAMSNSSPLLFMNVPARNHAPSDRYATIPKSSWGQLLYTINIEQQSSAVHERPGEKPRPERSIRNYPKEQLGTAALHYQCRTAVLCCS